MSLAWNSAFRKRAHFYEWFWWAVNTFSTWCRREMKQCCCLGSSISSELLPGSMGPSCCPTSQELGCSHHYPHCWLKEESCLLTGCRQGGWLVFHIQAEVLYIQLGANLSLQPSKYAIDQNQTTSRSTVTQSHSLAECREAWQHVVPIDLQRQFQTWGSDGCEWADTSSYAWTLISSSAAVSLNSISATLGLIFLPILAAGAN